MEESSSKGEITLWEKEKLLVTSNFSFSHSVFKGPELQTHENQGLFGKGLSGLSYKAIMNCEKGIHFSTKKFQTGPNLKHLADDKLIRLKN